MISYTKPLLAVALSLASASSFAFHPSSKFADSERYKPYSSFVPFSGAISPMSAGPVMRTMSVEIPPSKYSNLTSLHAARSGDELGVFYYDHVGSKAIYVPDYESQASDFVIRVQQGVFEPGRKASFEGPFFLTVENPQKGEVYSMEGSFYSIYAQYSACPVSVCGSGYEVNIPSFPTFARKTASFPNPTSTSTFRQLSEVTEYSLRMYSSLGGRFPRYVYAGGASVSCPLGYELDLAESVNAANACKIATIEDYHLHYEDGVCIVRSSGASSLDGDCRNLYEGVSLMPHSRGTGFYVESGNSAGYYIFEELGDYLEINYSPASFATRPASRFLISSYTGKFVSKSTAADGEGGEDFVGPPSPPWLGDDVPVPGDPDFVGPVAPDPGEEFPVWDDDWFLPSPPPKPGEGGDTGNGGDAGNEGGTGNGGGSGGFGMVCGGPSMPPCSVAITGGGGGMGSSCGGPSQPACKVDMSGLVLPEYPSLELPDFNPDFAGAEGLSPDAVDSSLEPGEDLGGLFDAVDSKLSGLTSLDLPVSDAACPALSFSLKFPGMASGVDFYDETMCGFLEDNRSLLSSLFLLIYLIGAIRIVLSA